MTAEKAARLFLNHVVANFGLTHEIMSDNDHLINSKFFNTLCSISGVTHHTSILYRPRGNGRAETGVRLIVRCCKNRSQISQAMDRSSPIGLMATQ